MVKTYLAAAAMIVAAPVFAAPVSLDCRRIYKEKMQPVQFVLDEEHQSAVMTYSPGFAMGLPPMSFQTNATFTPDQVFVRDWTINRVDLSFGNYQGWGKCKLVETPQRAF